MIVYRQLQPNEWGKLLDYFASKYPDYSVPSPEIAVVAVAEGEDGAIQGVLMQQLMWHREPLILEHPGVRFDKLVDVLNEAFADYPGSVYYAFIDHPVAAKLATAAGMEPMVGTLFKGGN